MRAQPASREKAEAPVRAVETPRIVEVHPSYAIRTAADSVVAVRLRD